MADDKACTGGAVRDRLLGLWIVAEEVDAMVTGRVTPIILLVVRLLSSRGLAGRRNAQRALDGNSFMCGANPHLSNNML